MIVCRPSGIPAMTHPQVPAPSAGNVHWAPVSEATVTVAPGNAVPRMPPPVAVPSAVVITGGESTCTCQLSDSPAARDSARTGTRPPSGRRRRAQLKRPSAVAVQVASGPGEDPPETAMTSPGLAVPETVSGKETTRSEGAGSSRGADGFGVGLGVSAEEEPASPVDETAAAAPAGSVGALSAIATSSSAMGAKADAPIAPRDRTCGGMSDMNSCISPYSKRGGRACQMESRYSRHTDTSVRLPHSL
ncbi:hypothetical protein ATY41_09060 [Leifsonia xyli subsp. xyli]|uniref:Uncharacterized protein n=1 Tax=Leifsonia xyli subsp. xyli TaxID=59736 RepID=A0A1E2SLE1_LEIXY|nr:hypothetical protein ATY41_09060 [Leifsonia xyli subsp. xyli]